MKIEISGNEFTELVRSLVETSTDSTFDAMTTARGLQKRYGIVVDWHQTSGALDRLCNRVGFLKIVGHNSDGMTQYSKI